MVHRYHDNDISTHCKGRIKQERAETGDHDEALMVQGRESDGGRRAIVTETNRT
jgi:hypothetical protein